MANKPSDNQSSFKDKNDLSIDVDVLYNDIVGKIDSFRSHVTINDTVTLLSNLDKFSFDRAIDSSYVKSTPQESRVSAFYRLIGLPIISDKDPLFFYNPGFDQDLNSQTSAKKEKIRKMINGISKPFLKFLEERERYYNLKIAPLFVKKDITASVVAMSIYNSRSFNVPMKDSLSSTDATTFTSKQQFAPIYGDPSGNYLTDYVDEDDNKPNILPYNMRGHYIRPLVVDPRVDLTVKPSTKLLAVPFALDQSKLKISDGVYLTRPFIEKVIRSRLTIINEGEEVGELAQEYIAYFKQFKALDNNEFLNNIIQNKVLRPTEQLNFQYYFNVIASLIKILVSEKETLVQTCNRFHWIPIPNLGGPEYGSKSRGLNYSNTDTFNTNFDQVAIKSEVTDRLKKLNNIVLNKVAPKYGLDSTLTSSSNINDRDSDGISAKITQQTKQITEGRVRECARANVSLQKIERIIGDFSGLGLIDIFSMFGALYTMEMRYLLGLLDDDALARMEKEFVVTAGDVGGQIPNVYECLEKLAAGIQTYYNLADKLEDDLVNNNSSVST